jgi:hypothetical protein
MLDFKTQSQLVDATAAMMRSCVTATTNTWAASACHGLSLWAELLGTGSRRGALTRQQPAVAAHPMGMMMWPSVANWMTAPQLYAWPSWPWLRGNAVRPAWTPGTWPGPTFSLWMPLADRAAWTSVPAWSGQPDATARPAADVARATKPAGFSSYRSDGGHAVAQIAAPVELTATAAPSPMHTMLGVWRAALGV